MEISLHTRLERISISIRLAFWRSISACIATIMRTPPPVRFVLTSLPLVVFGLVAYVLGRAAGSFLTARLH